MTRSDNETTATASTPESMPSSKPTTKPAAKPVIKSVRKPASAVATKNTPAKKKAKPAKPAKVAATETVKEKKPKLVRDSFTMPKLEFAVIDSMKLRAAKLAVPVKKTELIRAGIKALAAMPDADFLAAINAVPNLKTGRPAKTQEE